MRRTTRLSTKRQPPSDSSDDEEQEAAKPNKKATPPLKKQNQASDSSSSESDIEAYLKPADQIDLNSSFFQTEKEEPKSFAAIESSIFAGINQLSDSESEPEHAEQAGTSKPTQPAKEASKASSKVNFQQLHDYTKKLEEAKQLVAKYEARKKAKEKRSSSQEKKPDDISNLLALGEAKLDSSAEAQPSIHSSDYESYSESEKEDWEEVEHRDVEEQETVVAKDVQITVALPEMMRKKKGVDLVACMKRRLNRIRKENQVLVHKVHLLCWLGHGNYVNKVLNNEDILAMALSLLPSQHCYPPDRTDLNYLEQIVKWYKNMMSIVDKILSKNMSLEKALKIQINRKQAYNKKMFVYIFICILRSLGIQCRLLLSFEVAHLRPPSNELHSLSVKLDDKKDTEGKTDSKATAAQGTSKDKDKKIGSKITANETPVKKDLHLEKPSSSSRNAGKTKEPKKSVSDEKTNEKKTTKPKGTEVRASSRKKPSAKTKESESEEKPRGRSKSANQTPSQNKTKKPDLLKLKPAVKSKSTSELKSDVKTRKNTNNNENPAQSTRSNIPQMDGANDSEEEPSTSSKTKVNLKKLLQEEANPCPKKHPKRLRSLPNYTDLNSDEDFDTKASQRNLQKDSKPKLAKLISKKTSKSPSNKKVLKSNATKSPNEKRVSKNNTAESPNNKEVLKSNATKSPNEKRVSKNNTAESPSNKEVLKSNATKSPNEKRVSKNNTAESPNNKEVLKSNATKSPNEKRVSKNNTAESPSNKEVLKSNATKSPNDKRVSKNNTAESPSKKEVSKTTPTNLKKLKERKSTNSRPKFKNAQEYIASLSPKKKGGIRDDIISIMKSRISQEKAASRSNKVKSRKSRTASDEDSDYAPEPVKKKQHDSDDEFYEKTKVKVKQRVKVKKDDVDEEAKKRKGVDVWVEVFLESEAKWISADVVKGQVHCISEIYSRASHPITYIVAWNNDNSIKDVTQRYCSNWNTVTRKLRINNNWWQASLRPFKGRPTALDKEEDEELARLQLEKPLPTTISEYKNHPLYVLKRHLLKFEALYLPDSLTLGFVRNEPVYSRDCVHVLHSRDIWLKHAKVVKPGEQPYKIVKARPKYDRMSGKVITDLPLEVFGKWQVEDYVPPTAENGIVPRNAYGNVELFKECMLPKGTVHLQLPGLNKVAKKMNIDCAAAMVGFDFHGGWNHPLYDGFVVCEEYSEVLIAAWHMEQEEQEKRELEKIEKRVYGNWKKLIKGLLIRERLKARYNFGNTAEAGTSGKKKRSKGPKVVSKKRRLCSDSESDVHDSD